MAGNVEQGLEHYLQYQAPHIMPHISSPLQYQAPHIKPPTISSPCAPTYDIKPLMLDCQPDPNLRCQASNISFSQYGAPTYHIRLRPTISSPSY